MLTLPTIKDFPAFVIKDALVTKKKAGAPSEFHCVRPDVQQNDFVCSSGQQCRVRDVSGINLEDGHKLAILISCGSDDDD